MLNSILNAVTKQLGTTFGESYRYYTEDVEQGLKKPCFHVLMRTHIQRSRSPVLYDRTAPFVIHYFSDSKTNLKEHYFSMGEQIVECLEYLPFADTLIRGENISMQIVDNVLQIFITYKFTTKRITEVEENIQTLESNVTHKQ